MSTFLFVVFPEPGHLHPFLPIAERLVEAGHRVELFSPEPITVPRLVCHWPDARPKPRQPMRSRAFVRLLRDPVAARRWYTLVLLGFARYLEPLRRIVRELRPDVICTDSIAYAGAIVAEQEGIAWAAVSSCLQPLAPLDFRCPYFDILAELAPERDRLFAAHGTTARFKHGETISPWLNCVLATEALVPRAVADNTHSIYTGPSRASGQRGDEVSFPWERIDPARPLVYAAFGSQLSPSESLVTALIDVARSTRSQLVLSLNDAASMAVPDEVVAVRYAPQRELLERAVVMVSHGGANSVAEALAAGVPMLIAPLAHEQPLNAHLVTRSGAGQAFATDEVEDVTVERCDTLLRPLLEPGPHRERAAAIAASYATDGAQRVGELLVELAVTRAPLTVA